MKNLFLCALLSVTASAWAQAPANVEVKDAWVRATVAQQKSTGAFMQLTAQADTRVVQVSSPIAGVAEIHEMAMDKDVMRMRAVPALDLPAGADVPLRHGSPDGHHLMLLKLKQPLKDGEAVPVTFTAFCAPDSARSGSSAVIRITGIRSTNSAVSPNLAMPCHR